MKPPPFELRRARSLDEAVTALSEGGDDTRIIAGGQSLVPLLNLRLARPAALIDLTPVRDLDRVGHVDGELWLGALVPHATLAISPVVRRRVPVLAVAAGHVGHEAIRRRGTLGGSLAHADPAAELVAACAAVDARVVAVSVRGAREIAVVDLVVGPYETVLAPDEVVAWVIVPCGSGTVEGGFHEVAPRAGDYATVGVATARRTGGETAVACFGALTGHVTTIVDGDVDVDAPTIVDRLAGADGLDPVDRRLLERTVAHARGEG